MKSIGRRFAPVLLLAISLTGGAKAIADFRKGQNVWSKHVETNLLAEPGPLAGTQATVGFAEKLSIREVQGTWLRVKSKSGEGWVFQGNVSEEKPELAPSAGLTQVDASQTNTVAAARPLTPAAKDYAERHGQQDAQADIDWIDLESSRLTADELVAWMSTNRKGEYQP